MKPVLKLISWNNGTVNSLILFLVLQFADFVTTALALHLGGSEQNPLVRQFIGAFGVNGLVLAKTLVILVGTGAALAGKRRAIRWANVVFAAVVAWNVVVVARLAALAASK